jgi:hypothetical protein
MPKDNKWVTGHWSTVESSCINILNPVEDDYVNKRIVLPLEK